MSTIHQLGQLQMAGSKDCPTTYQIRSCPRCYAVLYWSREGQTEVTCDNCGTEIFIMQFKGPIDYVKREIRKHGLSWQGLKYLLWGVCQVLDHRLHLRKLLLYVFIKGVSYL